MVIGNHRSVSLPIRCVGSWLLLLALVPCVSDAANDGAQEWPDGRHRVDLSYFQIDYGEGDANLILPGYTVVVTPSVRVGVTGSYLAAALNDSDSGTGRERESGWGDGTISLQWYPEETFSANPWIPERLGLYSIITVPVGKRSLSLNAWDVELGLGVPLLVGSRFAFIPSVYYRTTFSESEDVEKDREAGVAPAVYWLFGERIYIGYAPNIAYDWQFDEWSYDQSLIAGKQFRSGFGVELRIERSDRLDPAAVRDDYAVVAGIHYVFGKLP